MNPSSARPFRCAERWSSIARIPSCPPCHNQMDPIGFGLESYDAVGAWRDHDGKVPIDTSGSLPDGKSFQGAKDLKQILRGQSDAFTHNLTEKLLTFALGRGLEPYDRCTSIRSYANGSTTIINFRHLVLEIVNSKPFQMRSGEGRKEMNLYEAAGFHRRTFLRGLGAAIALAVAGRHESRRWLRARDQGRHAAWHFCISRMASRWRHGARRPREPSRLCQKRFRRARTLSAVSQRYSIARRPNQ